jgi:hypothetical protein
VSVKAGKFIRLSLLGQRMDYGGDFCWGFEVAEGRGRHFIALGFSWLLVGGCGWRFAAAGSDSAAPAITNRDCRPSVGARQIPVFAPAHRAQFIPGHAEGELSFRLHRGFYQTAQSGRHGMSSHYTILNGRPI